MVQDQLVEYISSQFKLGISRDTIKSALTGVGWAPLDVEDTLKKVEGGATPPTSQPAAPQKMQDTAGTAAASPKFVSFSAPATVAGSGKGPEPQTIRVSDLVSSAAPASSMSAAGSPKVISAQKNPLMGTFSAATIAPTQKKKGINLIEILAVVLIVLLGALAGYLFFQNSGLKSQIQAQGNGNQSAEQASVAQVQALNASNTALTAQIQTLTSENQDLTTNLSFFVIPAGSASPVASTSISLSGVLSAGLGKNTYIITTSAGVKVSVKNSSDSAVAATLQPLLGNTIQASGTYIPGTANITIATVNGSPVSLPSVATTTAAATTTTTPAAVKTGAATSTLVP